MGRASLQDLLNQDPDFDVALRWHLGSNHFPPIHPDFDEPAKHAIVTAAQAIEEDDLMLWGETVELPNGIIKSVADIIEELHLRDFVDQLVAEPEED